MLQKFFSTMNRLQEEVSKLYT